jgi:hypothetical protein
VDRVSDEGLALAEYPGQELEENQKGIDQDPDQCN